MGWNRQENYAEYTGLKKDWKKEIIFIKSYNEHKEYFMKMVSELRETWDGILGTVRTVKKHISRTNRR